MTKQTILRFCLVMLCGTVAACASPLPAKPDPCPGELIEGPWFRFLLPSGMELSGTKSKNIETSSVWLTARSANESYSFFLFSPRHGGKAYPIFLNSTNVQKLVEYDTDSGKKIKYTITYEDGSIGHYEGDSQRVTGFRVADSPLGKDALTQYECFLDNIEQFAE